MEAVSESHGMHQEQDNHLMLGVPPPNSRHEPASAQCGQSIGHAATPERNNRIERAGFLNLSFVSRLVGRSVCPAYLNCGDSGTQRWRKDTKNMYYGWSS